MVKEKLAIRLPESGQLKSYMKFDDGYYFQKSPFFNKKRFVDKRNGTITDKATGLKWLKDPKSIGLTTYNWYEATLICKNLNLME